MPGQEIGIWTEEADATSDQPILGLEIKKFNWRLRRAREARGWSRAEVARQAGVPAGTVGTAEMLRPISPEHREKIAFALNLPEDHLFPGEIEALLNDGPSKIEIPFSTDAVAALTEGAAFALRSGEEQADLAVLRREIEEVLETLTERERAVVRARFGFDGPPADLQEVGRMQGVTRERIRQIETKALRNLRHPTRARILRDWLGARDDYLATARRVQDRQDREAVDASIPDNPYKKDVCRTEHPEPCRNYFGQPDPALLARGARGRLLGWCEPCWLFETNKYVRQQYAQREVRATVAAREHARYAVLEADDPETEEVHDDGA